MLCQIKCQHSKQPRKCVLSTPLLARNLLTRKEPVGMQPAARRGAARFVPSAKKNTFGMILACSKLRAKCPCRERGMGNAMQQVECQVPEAASAAWHLLPACI